MITRLPTLGGPAVRLAALAAVLGARPRVILLSSGGVTEEGGAADIDFVFPKPFSPEALLAAVPELLAPLPVRPVSQ